MPKKKGFEDCAKRGGKVVRKQLKGGRYIEICYDKEGKSHAGEIRVTKKNKKAKFHKKNYKANGKVTEEHLEKLKEHFDSQRNE
jgi:hypothetical protein